MERQQIKQQKQITAHDKKLTYDIFLNSIRWLEKYIEVVYRNEFPDWKNRKQIRDNDIKRTDIYQNPQKLKESLSTQLFLLESSVEEEPLREWIKQEFYKWISAVGIDANNCPEELKQYLFGLNEILEGRGGKLLKDAENRKRDVEIGSPEYYKQMSSLFANIQAPMRDEKEIEKALKGKNWREVDIESGFGTNVEGGEKIINQIANQVANKHDSFHFYPQTQQQDNTPKLLRTVDNWQDFNRNELTVTSNNGQEETYYLGEGTETLTNEEVGFANQRAQELRRSSFSQGGEVWVVGGGLFLIATGGIIRFFGRSMERLLS